MMLNRQLAFSTKLSLRSFSSLPSSYILTRHLTRGITNCGIRPVNHVPVAILVLARRNFHYSKNLWNDTPKLKRDDQLKVTKTKLLKEASGPVSRLMIHIKWLMKRNDKPFSIDDLSAMFSWLVMGNVLWILLGTTTFGLVLLYSLHTFDKLSSNVLSWFHRSDDDEKTSSNEGGSTNKKDDSIVGYLTSSILSYGLGIKIEFQKKSVLPEFKDGKLLFKNISIISEEGPNVPFTFQCNIESLKLSLSFSKWSDGNGLINDLEAIGLHGKVFKEHPDGDSYTIASPVVFRRYHDSIHFQYDMNDQADVYAEPRKLSRVDPNYEISDVKIYDSFLEIYDSKESEDPLKISIFNCELPKITGKTLLIDFFNADNVTGSINESMFTIHKKQQLVSEGDDKTIRFKIDGIDMGRLSRMNPKLKFNWILTGKAEIIADIRFPNNDLEDNSLFKVEYKKISDIIGGILTDLSVITNKSSDVYDEDSPADESKLLKGALQAVYQTFDLDENDYHHETNNGPVQEYVLVSAKVKFYNLRATLPKELPMANGNVPFLTLHDLRNIIAYINKIDTDNRPPLIVKTMVIEKIEDLYNLEHLTQARLFDVIVSDIYEELLKLVHLDEQRIINEKNSLWSHSIASQLLLLGLGVIV